MLTFPRSFNLEKVSDIPNVGVDTMVAIMGLGWSDFFVKEKGEERRSEIFRLVFSWREQVPIAAAAISVSSYNPLSFFCVIPTATCNKGFPDEE